jgi:hypothetical protein
MIKNHKQRYKHDDSSCVYLGWDSGGYSDLFLKTGQNFPTFISRQSDDPRDFVQGNLGSNDAEGHPESYIDAAKFAIKRMLVNKDSLANPHEYVTVGEIIERWEAAKVVRDKYDNFVAKAAAETAMAWTANFGTIVSADELSQLTYAIGKRFDQRIENMIEDADEAMQKTYKAQRRAKSDEMY